MRWRDRPVATSHRWPAHSSSGGGGGYKRPVAWENLYDAPLATLCFAISVADTLSLVEKNQKLSGGRQGAQLREQGVPGCGVAEHAGP